MARLAVAGLAVPRAGRIRAGPAGRTRRSAGCARADRSRAGRTRLAISGLAISGLARLAGRGLGGGRLRVAARLDVPARLGVPAGLAVAGLARSRRRLGPAGGCSCLVAGCLEAGCPAPGCWSLGPAEAQARQAVLRLVLRRGAAALISLGRDYPGALRRRSHPAQPGSPRRPARHRRPGPAGPRPGWVTRHPGTPAAGPHSGPDLLASVSPLPGSQPTLRRRPAERPGSWPGRSQATSSKHYEPGRQLKMP